MRQKIRRLRLEVVEQRKNTWSTTTCVSLVLPEELPSIEAALKLFATISGRSGTVLGILWVRFRKKKNRIKIKKYDFFSSQPDKPIYRCKKCYDVHAALTKNRKEG